jgi:cell division septum initiation protein DivIVA
METQVLYDALFAAYQQSDHATFTQLMNGVSQEDVPNLRELVEEKLDQENQDEATLNAANAILKLMTS